MGLQWFLFIIIIIFFFSEVTSHGIWKVQDGKQIQFEAIATFLMIFKVCMNILFIKVNRNVWDE